MGKNEYEELIEALMPLANALLESAVKGMVQTFSSADHLNRFTDDQFDRMWAVVVEDFLPYAVDVRGKDWPREPKEQIA